MDVTDHRYVPASLHVGQNRVTKA